MTLRVIVIFVLNGATSIYLIGTAMISYIILFSDKNPIFALRKKARSINSIEAALDPELCLFVVSAG